MRTPANKGDSAQALCRTRTDDPFLTVEAQGSMDDRRIVISGLKSGVPAESAGGRFAFCVG
jgi:hypothetical protein